MRIASRLSHFYNEAKGNKWYHYFAVFCRVMLAIGFIISGLVKITGERFASGLSVNHPMGHYLEALYYTGYYYTFIGIAQLIVALLLLVPRTALLGALMYFPIILNICVLAYAVRFEGTRITTLMLLANVYLLSWDYDRIKYLVKAGVPVKRTNKKFPTVFFGLVVVMIAAVIVINQFMYDIRPGNAMDECVNGCAGNKNPKACLEFCDCIHKKGKTLNECLAAYNKAKAQQKDQ